MLRLQLLHTKPGSSALGLRQPVSLLSKLTFAASEAVAAFCCKQAWPGPISGKASPACTEGSARTAAAFVEKSLNDG